MRWAGILAVALWIGAMTSIGDGRPLLSATSVGRAGDDRFGIAFVNGMGYRASEGRYQQAVDAGARWTRWPLYWYEVETQPGRLDDEAYRVVDEVVERDLAHGLRINAILLGTPHWAATGGTAAAPEPKVEQKGLVRALGVEPLAVSVGASPPANLHTPALNPDGTINQNNYWARFVYHTVSRYRDRVKVWELWNEPDLKTEGGDPVFWSGSRGDYYQLLRVGYQAAKAADPTSTVLFAGLAYWSDRDFFPHVLDLIQADPTAPLHNGYFDVLPLHLYSSPYHLFLFPPWFREEMKKRGLSKPIWVNETNLPVCDDKAVDSGLSCPSPWRGTMEEQAAFVLQAYALGAAAGVERIFVFQFYDDDVGPNDWYGLVRNNGQPRPSYTAYRVAAKYLVDPATVQREVSGRVESVVFTGTPQGKITVLWNYTEVPTTARVRASSGTAVLVDKDGKERALTPTDGFYLIDLAPATHVDYQTGLYSVGGVPLVLVEPMHSQVSSQVEPLPRYVPATSFAVRWKRLDTSGGPVRYDIQFKEGANGSWVTWLADTEATQAVFGPEQPIIVKEGQSYYFRSRAKDEANNPERIHPEEGDTFTQVPYFLQGRVRDNRGIPLSGGKVVALDTPFSTIVADGGVYRLGVYPQGIYDVGASAQGYGKQPAKRLEVSSGMTYDLYLPPEVDLIKNGGFELGLFGWSPSVNVYLKSFRHTGEWGAYLASPATLSQKIVVPSDMRSPTLSFVYRVPSGSSLGKLTVTLLGKTLSRRVEIELLPEDVWRHHWVDLRSLEGEVTVEFRWDGTNAILWLDEVSVGPGFDARYIIYLPNVERDNAAQR